MSKITKQFVGLEDLMALRAVCDHCGASLSLPIMGNAFRLPERCPSCMNDWYQSYGNGPSIGNIAAKLAQDVRALRHALENRDITSVRLSLDVEINGLSGVPFSSNRDA